MLEQFSPLEHRSNFCFTENYSKFFLMLYRRQSQVFIRQAFGFKYKPKVVNIVFKIRLGRGFLDICKFSGITVLIVFSSSRKLKDHEPHSFSKQQNVVVIHSITQKKYLAHTRFFRSQYKKSSSSL